MARSPPVPARVVVTTALHRRPGDGLIMPPVVFASGGAAPVEVGGAVRVRFEAMAVGDPAACCRVYVVPSAWVMYAYQPVAPPDAAGLVTVIVDDDPLVVVVA